MFIRLSVRIPVSKRRKKFAINDVTDGEFAQVELLLALGAVISAHDSAHEQS
jgi:hypothetical protein